MNDINDKEASTTVIGVTNPAIDGHSSSLTQENVASYEKGVATPEPTIVDIKPQEDEEWETDPDNARNWSWSRKWVATGIVGLWLLLAANSDYLTVSCRYRSTLSSLLLPALWWPLASPKSLKDFT